MNHLFVATQTIAVDSSATNTSNKFTALLSRYKDSLEKRLNDTIVINDLPLTKALPESTLGNLFADAILRIPSNIKIDAAIVNYGSIGIEYFAPGPLLRKDVYKLIPFENNIVLISVTGKELQIICDSIAQRKGLPLAGLTFIIENSKAQNVLLNAQPIHPNLVYRIALNEYLIQSKMFQAVFSHKNYKQTGISLRAAVFKYLQAIGNKKHLKIVLDNRISYAE